MNNLTRVGIPEDMLQRRRSTQQRTDINFLKNTPVVYYQPVVEAGNSAMTCYLEALGSIRDAQGALLPPAAFLRPLCDQRLFPSFIAGVLDQVFRFQRTSRLIVPVSISVPSHCLTEEVYTRVFQTLAYFAVNPSSLLIEITEDKRGGNNPGLADSMHAMHTLGIRFVLDNFTGEKVQYQTLQQLPFSLVKLNRVFFMNQHTSELAFICNRLLGFGVKQVVVEGGSDAEVGRVLTLRRCVPGIQVWLRGYPNGGGGEPNVA